MSKLPKIDYLSIIGLWEQNRQIARKIIGAKIHPRHPPLPKVFFFIKEKTAFGFDLENNLIQVIKKTFNNTHEVSFEPIIQ